MIFPKLFVSPKVCVEEGQEGKLLKFNGLQRLIFKMPERETFIRYVLKFIILSILKTEVIQNGEDF